MTTTIVLTLIALYAVFGLTLALAGIACDGADNNFECVQRLTDSWGISHFRAMMYILMVFTTLWPVLLLLALTDHDQ